MEANKSKVYEIIPVIHDQPGEVKYYIMADNPGEAELIFKELNIPHEKLEVTEFISEIYF
jgi:hypothetical protein